MAKAKPPSAKNHEAMRQALLEWYAHNKRDMPWRHTHDPYPIWLSEIMLQQTGVSTVVGYYHRFLEAFPTLHDLAAAEQEAVLHLWQGLGYYSRARNLHACAQTLVANYDGRFPETPEGLMQLKGIGDYTANAIAAFAFNHPEAAVVDGNVERVLSRVYAVEETLPKAKPVFKALAQTLADPANSREYNNAIMELGATICTPTKPACLLCPWQTFCAKANAPDVATFPRKTPKKKVPEAHATAYVLQDAQGRVYLRQRPEKGLLASLWEVPHVGWESDTLPFPPNLVADVNWEEAGYFTHVFTHLKLHVDVRVGTTEKPLPNAHAFQWGDKPLPTLMRKVERLVKS